LWDTETGKVTKSFVNSKTPYCITFHPEKSHIMLAGYSNRKIIQYDLRSGEIALTYEEHIGGITSLTFLDNNKRFVSTADDKKVYLWEFGIPVVIKHV